MWFKKKSQISGFNANTAEDGTDWHISHNDKSWTVSNTPPSAADAGNYFFLPALGYYLLGQLYEVGSYGYYWSSSAYLWDLVGGFAYYLYFNSGSVKLGYDGFRTYGYRVDGFE